MLRIWHRPADGSTLVPVAGEGLDEVLGSGGWTWIDLLLDGGADEMADLAARFGFDDLAVEDAVAEIHYPKIDDFGSYLLVVLHGLDEEEERLVTTETDVFLGEHYLVTVHHHHSPSIEWLSTAAQENSAYGGGGPDLMLARLAEVQGRRYLPLVDAIDDRIEELEERAIDGDPDVVGEIQGLRRDIIVLRRVAGPQREVLMTLGRPMSPLVAAATQLRFDSVYDHYYRLVETIDGDRALLAAVLDTYRSTVAEKMNEVMKVLTVFAAILLPLSLLAGIYGMNFVNMPELRHPDGYFVLLGVMAALAVGLWIYFVRRGFIGGFRPHRIPRVIGSGLSRIVRLPIEASTSGARRRED